MTSNLVRVSLVSNRTVISKIHSIAVMNQGRGRNVSLSFFSTPHAILLGSGTCNYETDWSMLMTQIEEKREPRMAFLLRFWEALGCELLHLVMLHAKKINVNTNRTMLESDWISCRIQSLSFYAPNGLVLLSIWYIFTRKMQPARYLNS